MEPHRFQKIFLDSLGASPLAKLLDLGKEAEISFFMDQSPIQDSFRYRGKHVALKVAGLLLDEKGELIQERLDELVGLLEGGIFVLGPRREGDALIYGHILGCLRQLREIWPSIRKFSPPLCHKKAEEVIRDTLWPETFRRVETGHVRKAVLAAWLTSLRQSTGSCFATAPAILVQRNDPIRFFKDLYDLLSMGQMKRIVAGKEYAVPLSLSSGLGELQRVAPFLENSPGLWAALEAGGLAMSGAVQKKIREMGPRSAEQVIRSLLLENGGLTEEDVEDEERLAQLQMSIMLAKQTAVYYQKPSERGQRVAEWKKRFAKACTTFRTFTECALLRSWEYTIASFCDVKTEFSRWNLYIGLGIHPDQKGGIGEFLYAQVDGQLQKCNQQIEGLAQEYEKEMGSLQALETMIQASVSEGRRNQLKSEWMTHNLAANSILGMRNEVIAKAESLTRFFSSLIEQYDQKLQEYFQELFDPVLLGEEAHLYDDSAAGFRLVYKHGRTDASQWTPIYNGEEYIHSLRDFFSIVEGDIEAPPQIEREIVSEITTALIQFIQDRAFLEGAMRRSKEMGRRSPWDYISGGTMQTLLQAYCNRSSPFTESKIVPHSERDLLHFLGELKEKGPHLMHSPTHAFIVYPELLPKNSESVIEENQQRAGKWDEVMQEHLAHRVSERLPDEEKALFLHLYRQKNTAETNGQFRSYLIEALGSRVKNPVAIVDSVLYEQTPLFSEVQAKDGLKEIFLALGMNVRVEKLEESLFGPYDLYQIAKTLLLEKMGSPFSSRDWDEEIVETMRRLGLCQSHKLLFADTNWSGWFFGFVVNPATGHLELWRLNRNGMQGFPMSDWKEWLSPKNSSPWIFLAKAEEYSSL